MKEIITINTEQIRMMKHALGFENRKIRGTKNRKYEAYRNYFTTSDNDKELDSLVEKGLMHKRNLEHGVGDNPQVYHVTDKGLEFLAELTCVQITEMR